MSNGAKAAVLVGMLVLGIMIGRGSNPKPRRGDPDPAKVFVVTAVTIDGKTTVIEDARFDPDPMANGKNLPESWRYDLDDGRVVLKAMRIDRASFRTAKPGDLAERPAPLAATANVD